VSRNSKIWDQDKFYFLSFATVNWIDALTKPIYKDIIVESLKYCIENKGLEVSAWCIMSNHIHLIIDSEQQKIEDIIRDLKRHTSKAILKAILKNPQESRSDYWVMWMFERAGQRNSNNQNYQFWQQNNQPIILDSNFKMDQKLDYLHKNPVLEGYVLELEHYIYISAVDYTGVRGMIPITFIQ